jgi:hypothetical protein
MWTRESPFGNVSKSCSRVPRSLRKGGRQTADRATSVRLHLAQACGNLSLPFILIAIRLWQQRLPPLPQRTRQGWGTLELFSGSKPARKRMRSGDRPGLQNRRAAGNPVTGGFDPHSLPPFFHQRVRNGSAGKTQASWWKRIFPIFTAIRREKPFHDRIFLHDGVYCLQV